MIDARVRRELHAVFGSVVDPVQHRPAVSLEGPETETCRELNDRVGEVLVRARVLAATRNVIDEAVVVKLFPRATPGPHPAVDVPAHLAANGFTETPAALGATNTTFANNILVGGGLAAKIDGPNRGAVWSGNMLWQTKGAGDMPAAGFEENDPRLVKAVELACRELRGGHAPAELGRGHESY